jgi:exodeoxyribonuclease VII small subunit
MAKPPPTRETAERKPRSLEIRRAHSVSDGPGARDGTDIVKLTFDEALAELQRTVAELEQGGLPLERSIALYERGVLLQERCAALLGDAELRVQRLVERSSGAIEVAQMRANDDSEEDRNKPAGEPRGV